MNQKKKDSPAESLNEFDQTVEGNSLGKDAWKRLKKNKMAVLGMVIVIIYTLLAVFAAFLPIYPYDEIILDHQHLPPSFNTSAGELMMKTKLQDVYFKAWKSGNLVIPEDKSAQIKQWITDNKITTVWNYCYTEGERQRKAGTFAFSDADQKSIDRLQKRIDTELLVSVKKIFWTDQDTQKVYVVEKMAYEKVLSIFATINKVTVDSIREQTTQEVRSQVMNDIKSKNPGLSDEEYNANLEMELKSMGPKGFETMAKANLLGKINTQITRSTEKSLAADIKAGTANFPMKKTIKVSDTLTAQIQASRKHARHYLFGTDYSGRDMLSRIIHGGQVSIAIGFVGTLTSVLLGIVLGALAGYLGGKVDYFLMRLVDIMYGLPYMLLVIICMAVFGRNILNLFVALALVSWLTIARMVRGQVMSLKNSEFVEAARSMGASSWRIIFKHMVPNSLSIIIVYSTLRIPAFIMQESFLSFLGLGVQAPYASWGSLVGDAVTGMTLYPWKLIFPAIAMTIFLFAMNFFGDGLRDAFDPQSKNQL